MVRLQYGSGGWTEVLSPGIIQSVKVGSVIIIVAFIIIIIAVI